MLLKQIQSKPSRKRRRIVVWFGRKEKKRKKVLRFEKFKNGGDVSLRLRLRLRNE